MYIVTGEGLVILCGWEGNSGPGREYWQPPPGVTDITHTHPFNGPLSGTSQVSRYQKGKTNLDFSKARHSERQWHQLGYMQVCTSLQTDNHASTPPLSFLQAGFPSCRPTNSVKALKAIYYYVIIVTLTHPFNSPISLTTQVSWYQKGKTNLDFTEARDIEWQWHQLGRVQVCTLLQRDNHASTPPLSFLQAGFPSCRPTNSVKALKAYHTSSLLTCTLY